MLIRYGITTVYPEAKINAVQVSRETDTHVFIATPRKKVRPSIREALKRGGAYEYYDTWDDAHKALQQVVDCKINNLLNMLCLALQLRTDVRYMKRPQEGQRSA